VPRRQLTYIVRGKGRSGLPLALVFASNPDHGAQFPFLKPRSWVTAGQRVGLPLAEAARTAGYVTGGPADTPIATSPGEPFFLPKLRGLVNCGRKAARPAQRRQFGPADEMGATHSRCACFK
jgi:hypothetical protein